MERAEWSRRAGDTVEISGKTVSEVFSRLWIRVLRQPTRLFLLPTPLIRRLCFKTGTKVAEFHPSNGDFVAKSKSDHEECRTGSCGRNTNTLQPACSSSSSQELCL